MRPTISPVQGVALRWNEVLELAGNPTPSFWQLDCASRGQMFNEKTNS
jgi:hypothetical protein